MITEKVNSEYLSKTLIPTYLKALRNLIETVNEQDIDDEYNEGKLVGIYDGILELTNQHYRIRNSLEFV